MAIRGDLEAKSLGATTAGFTMAMERLRTAANPAETPAGKQEKHEEVCSACNGLVHMDNQPCVRVTDRGGDLIFIFHRDCIESTEMRIPILLKNGRVRLARLRNLWKLSAKGDGLKTDSPKIILAQQIDPDGVKYSVLIPTDIKIPPDTIVKEISKPNQNVENAVRKAYEKGPWGAEFYDKIVTGPNSWKEVHTYFVQFMCLAEIRIAGDKVFVFVKS